jgi:hypothetical protein
MPSWMSKATPSQSSVPPNEVGSMVTVTCSAAGWQRSYGPGPNAHVYSQPDVDRPCNGSAIVAAAAILAV